MQAMKSFVTPLVLAAVMGLGFGLGFAKDAQASVASCRAECTAEFQACRAEGGDNGYPGFYRCRQWWSACLRACG